MPLSLHYRRYPPARHATICAHTAEPPPLPSDFVLTVVAGFAEGIGAFGEAAHREGVGDRVQHDVLRAQVVLLPGMTSRQRAELLSELEAMADVLRRDKVLRHLDAGADVDHLVGAACGDEDGLPLVLQEAVALHARLLPQPLAHRSVDVKVGVVDRVRQPLRGALLARHLPQELDESLLVLSAEDVPQRARCPALGLDPLELLRL